ncbi:hypothetical protein SynA1825c_00921 [Synechococcus sp. A18-25c]|nr:hypothetical protein SynA1825c_00921 [Synechococcus sp. A18-25c]
MQSQSGEVSDDELEAAASGCSLANLGFEMMPEIKPLL